MAFHWKQGLVVAPLFAVGGYIVCFFGNLNITAFLGIALARLLEKVGFIHIFMDEIYGYVIYGNAVVFGISGFFVGAFVRSWKHAVITVLILVGYILLVFVSNFIK